MNDVEGRFGLTVYDQLPPVKGFPAVSVMPWPGANVTVTAPAAGGGNSKMNCDGEMSRTLVAATPLMRKSDASTPVIGPSKITSTWGSVRTTPLLPGITAAMVGAIV